MFVRVPTLDSRVTRTSPFRLPIFADKVEKRHVQGSLDKSSVFNSCALHSKESQ
ncbi:hypothetical protein M413DRAFT_438651 [Hebeloma cylindrosporum]|uniref:Uncharacterized protein n=1 Tax=Hebeloma cylindrosporum TaxID=76867 RepID=A0A0C3CL94_HEBCY|nr:hypothetical protein M413DRAFT_438651 [Hebeloma cylindrosporum h7]